MKVWIPEMYTEAHRTADRQRALQSSLAAEGVEATAELEVGCDVALCGSIFMIDVLQAKDLKRRGIPTTHLNWDLYPWQLTAEAHELWLRYVEEMKGSAAVFVPSEAVRTRTRDLCGGLDTIIMHPPANPWELPKRPRPDRLPAPGSYVLNVMRPYCDPNTDAARRVCSDLGVPLVETATATEWDDFRWLVAGARFLVSPYYEASTGGLTLLEGMRHGVRSLIAASPYNGAGDYFGDLARYFRWDNRRDLRETLWGLWTGETGFRPLSPDVCRAWVDANFSDQAFAKRLARELLRFKR